MHSKRQGKLRTTLFLTAATVMATLMATPEAYGAAQRQREFYAQQERARQALENSKKQEEAKVKAEEVKVASLDTYRKALGNPQPLLETVDAGSLSDVITNAVADADAGALGFNALHHGSAEERIRSLKVIEAQGDARANPYRVRIRKILGIDADLTRLAGTKAEVETFLAVAEDRVAVAALLAGLDGSTNAAKLEAALTRIKAATRKAAGKGARDVSLPGAKSLHVALTAIGL